MVQSHGIEHAGPVLLDGADVAAGRADASCTLPYGDDEAYFVLDGIVEFRVAGTVFEGKKGAFVLVQAGESHTFGNTGDEPARLLVLDAPALDGYFEELEELWASAVPPDRDTELDLMRRHGMDPA